MDDERIERDVISISDEDGNNYELEHLDTIEINDVFYLAFVPADMDPEDEHYGMLLFKSVEDESGDQYLELLEEEEENMVYEKFMERLFNEDGDEADEDID